MNFFAFITYVVVTTFTPGPNNMMAMSNGLQDGFRKTLRFLAGVCGICNSNQLVCLFEFRSRQLFAQSQVLVEFARHGLHDLFGRPYRVDQIS